MHPHHFTPYEIRNTASLIQYSFNWSLTKSMFFYIINHVLNSLPWTADWTESKKNCLNLILGVNLYILFFVLLEWMKKSGVGGTLAFFSDRFRNFYPYVIGADCFAVAILFKKYFNRSILTELFHPVTDTPNYDNADKDESVKKEDGKKEKRRHKQKTDLSKSITAVMEAAVPFSSFKKSKSVKKSKPADPVTEQFIDEDGVVHNNTAE